MRLDKYLKVSRLIKRRTVANEACDAGRVLVNGKPARASYEVKVGDVISISLGTREVRAQVADVQETVAKNDAALLYKLLADPLTVTLVNAGKESIVTLTNTSDRVLRVRDICVYRETHTYASFQQIYGEGFQMLSQYTGTVGAPRPVTGFSDAGHYRLPERPGFHTVYNLLAVQQGARICDLYAFTSCGRFNGRIQWNATSLEMVLDLEDLPIPPGATIEAERLCVLKGVETARAFQTVGELLAANHPPKALPDRPAGWCSWYCFGAQVTQEHIDRNTAVIARCAPQLSFIQIDDGYQAYMGDWLDVNGAFGDLSAVLDKIERNGCLPAIWVAPFIAQKESRIFKEHPEYFVHDETGAPLSSGDFTFGGWRCGPWYMLDGTHPGAQKYLTHVFSVMRQQMHITYFKLDATVWGCFSTGLRFDKNATSVEAYRQGMEAIFRGAGEDAVILGCNAPMWPSVGAVNAMRISTDLGRSMGAFAGLHREIAPRCWMNRRLWINDPDVFTLQNRGDSALTENEFRFHKSLIFLSGGMILCGDDMTLYGEQELADVQTMLTAPCTTPETDCFDGSVIRSGPYVGLFNPQDTEKRFAIPVENCVGALELWSGRAVRIEGGILSLTLPARDAAVIQLCEK